jgi:hypothetical protein
MPLNDQGFPTGDTLTNAELAGLALTGCDTYQSIHNLAFETDSNDREIEMLQSALESACGMLPMAKRRKLLREFFRKP